MADGILPIADAFGNASGCAFFMTGKVLDEDLQLLTPDNFSAAAATCHFEQVIAEATDYYVVAASCNGAVGASQVTVHGEAATGYFVALGETLPEWGPLIACPGAGDVFKPLGTQV
ncbi:MAG: hypothetical protein ABI414_12590 [Devosia sp.]